MVANRQNGKNAPQKSPTSAQQPQPRPFAAPIENEPETISQPQQTQLSPKTTFTFGSAASNSRDVSTVSRNLIQAKLTLGQPNDAYEQEADHVAAKVVNQLHAPAQTGGRFPFQEALPMVQREALSEEELQMKPSGQGILARKLHQGTSPDSGFVHQKQNLIQRRIEPIGGKSSGPRQGERDRLNILVAKYNNLEEQHLGVQTIEALQQELKDIDSILQRAGEWEKAVTTKKASSIKDIFKSTEKRKEIKDSKIEKIQTWIRTVRAEKTRKQKQYQLEQEQHQLEQEQRQLEAVQLIYQTFGKFEDNVNLTEPTKQLNQLEQLAMVCKKWLSFPGSANSTHKQGVENVANSVKEKIETTKANNSLSEVEESDFSVANRTQHKELLDSDGDVSKVFEDVFTLNIKQGETKDYKLNTGGEFKGFYKADIKSMGDSEFNCTRAGKSGLPKEEPRLAERNIAMYKLEKLLNAGVIPPTFRVKHAEEAGSIMQEVIGKQLKYTLDAYGGVRSGKEDLHAVLTSGVARKALSRLYLLDIIAGQVDRHYGNVIVELEKNELGQNKAVGVKGIDNDQSFGKDYKDIEYGNKQIPKYNPTFGRLDVAGLRAQELTEIDMDFALSIMSLVSRENEVRDALKDLITADEVDATISRLKSLANFLGDLFKTKSDILKTAGDWKDKAVKK